MTRPGEAPGLHRQGGVPAAAGRSAGRGDVHADRGLARGRRRDPAVHAGRRADPVASGERLWTPGPAVVRDQRGLRPVGGKHLLMAYLPAAVGRRGQRAAGGVHGRAVPGHGRPRPAPPAVRPGQRADPELGRFVMEILVCVKRVPTVGGKITVTPDGQDVDTRMSGFSISPHEECAVEEAVQITERMGGTVSVLTLGPRVAIEQLRDALALGAPGGPCCWRPTAGSRPDRHRSPPSPHEVKAHGGMTWCCRATRRPTGNYQVGIRLAHELGLAGAHRVKNLTVTPDGPAWPAGSTAASRRPTRCVPPWSPSRRASTCPATRRCPGGCGPSGPRSSGSAPGLGAPRGCTSRRYGCPRPASTQATVLGHGADAVPQPGPRPGRAGSPLMSERQGRGAAWTEEGEGRATRGRRRLKAPLERAGDTA